MATNTRPDPDSRPPAVPWIQALAIVATVAVAGIDAWFPDFSPPREIYLLFGAAIVGLGRDDVPRLLREWRRK